MNELLGARIKNLREAKGLTQEQIAEQMKCTRQKYARLEKGLVDISYSNIVSISNILDVEIENIISSVNNSNMMEPMFRITDNQEADEKLVFLNTMLDTFYAHRKLYNSVRQVNTND